MTYRLLADEFESECETVGLTDAAYRLHVSMLGWSVDKMLDGTISTSDIRRVMPDDYTQAAQELVDVGFWCRAPKGWQIVHHLDRQIDAETLRLKRRNDAERQRNKRRRDAEKAKRSSSSLTAGLSEPNLTEPNQGHVGRHTVSHAVTNPQEDPWRGETA